MPTTPAAITPRGYLALPRAFLHHILPGLTDTELRVLLIVLLRTVGWVDRGKPRTHAWIARSVLVRETGRSPDAVSRATQSLIAKGLLLVTGEKGQTADAVLRRRLARLYFAPVLPQLGFTEAGYVSDGPPDRVIKNAANVETEKQPVTFAAQNETQPDNRVNSRRVEEEKRRIRERLARFSGKQDGV